MVASQSGWLLRIKSIRNIMLQTNMCIYELYIYIYIMMYHVYNAATTTTTTTTRPLIPNQLL